jgi:hypothetical protein
MSYGGIVKFHDVLAVFGLGLGQGCTLVPQLMGQAGILIDDLLLVLDGDDYSHVRRDAPLAGSISPGRPVRFA